MVNNLMAHLLGQNNTI